MSDASEEHNILIEFIGSRNEEKQLQNEGSDFEITDSYVMGSSSRGSVSKIELRKDKNSIIQLTTEDEFEWIGYYEDIAEIQKTYLSKDRSRSRTKLNISSTLHTKSSSRTFQTVVRNTGIDFITKKGSKIAANELAKWADRRLQPKPGLFFADEKLDNIPSLSFRTGTKYLLLLHGTFSNTKGAFSDMSGEMWTKIYEKYQGNVISFDHYTIGTSPFQNAIELIEGLPEKIDLDILAHSRGGLIADLLARCDHRIVGEAFSEVELSIIGKDTKSGTSKIEMESLVQLARNRIIQVDKIIRVGCPASGTTLLDKRLDHFLNFLMNAIQQAFGGPANFLYRVVKTFLLEVVSSRYDASIFPGLWSMVPQSSFQRINNGKFSLPSELYTISGDSEMGSGLLNSMKVILSNLYYREANDFVVNTKSMMRGMENRSRFMNATISSSTINHFTYFKDAESAKLIIDIFNEAFDSNDKLKPVLGNESRGWLKDLIVLKEVTGVMRVTDDKPVVILLPGIMGSCLHHNNNLLWVNGKAIGDGALNNYLKIEGQNITSNSALSMFYGDFKKYFEENGFQVVIFSFDWRKSVAQEAIRFEETMQDVLKRSKESHIVSHSMGGLVVREWMNKPHSSWEQFKLNPKSKWIMLGTPWLGSYLIMEVLTGHSKRLRQLDCLDETDLTRKELINLISEYPGIMELLPIWQDSDKFHDVAFWQEIQQVVGESDMPIPSQNSLDHYKAFRNKYQRSGIHPKDREKVFYIAGNKSRTVCGYQKRDRFFNGQKLVYLGTKRGDGSVTWDTGIPKNLDPSHLYYADVSHSNLANKWNITTAIKDIIYHGVTDRLPQSEVGLRKRGESIDESYLDYTEEVIDYYESEDFLDNIFDIDSHAVDELERTEIINVNVYNADLRWTRNPIMVGHYDQDSIVSAESAVDRYLEGKLSERLAIGSYPNMIGTQSIIFAPDMHPKGAIVVGLGPKDVLTSYDLAKSVEKAIINYAISLRDHFSDSVSVIAKDAISSLFIATSYGNLSKEESVRSIITGIHRANKVIAHLNNGLVTIKHLEFVDYYEDKAYECYKILTKIEKESNQIHIQLKDDIERGYGSKRRFLRTDSSSWWHSLTTTLSKDKNYPRYLKFSSYSGAASVSTQNVYANLGLAEFITEEMSQSSEWNERNSKTVFELLLPNAYKDFIRNHRNIEWKMDEYAAQFPWEMFHDSNYGDKPTFVETGIIRQLYSAEVSTKPMIVTNNRALVIGDPNYNMPGLNQLEGALEEARKVASILEENRVNVESKLRSTAMEIIKSLLAEEYKIIHIAGHGFYDSEKDKVGIAIGDGQFLDPGTINQFTAIPEFVFINCCFSGKIVAQEEKYHKNRHKLAANVGTQFIKIGAKAVIVAGWEVDDAAGLDFASQFYKHMYEGDIFGYAIQKARSYVYEKHKNTNTWGAYQCYGDQFYKFKSYPKYENGFSNYTLESEIALELNNILSSSRSIVIAGPGSKSPLTKITIKARRLIERARELNKYTGKVMMQEAEIYMNLGHYDHAITIIEELSNLDSDCLTLNILDRYYNIKSKKILRDSLAGAKYENCCHDMRSITETVRDKKFFSLGKTYDKLNTTASTLKRAGILIKEEREEYFENSSLLYLEAAELVGLRERTAIYPATSFILLTYLRYKRKQDFTRYATNHLGMSPSDYIEMKIKDIASEKSDRNDIWDQLVEIQLKVCRLLIEKNDLEERAENIKELYRKQISHCINVKDLVGEIEQMHFLEMVDSHRIKRPRQNDLFGEIKEELEGFLEKMK